jgi:transposase
MTSRGGLKMTPSIVGVDIGKDWLDAHRRCDGKGRRLPSTKAGRRALIGWSDGARVAFEPTGPCHRALERHLAAAGIDAVKINPLQARRFVEAVGCRAKTDAVDARLIAAMAAQLDLPTTAPLPETTRDLKALQIARQGLVEDRTAAENRAQRHECRFLESQAAARLRHVEAQLAALDAQIAALSAGDADLARRSDSPIGSPGVSAVTAATLLAEAPELAARSTAKPPPASPAWRP